MNLILRYVAAVAHRVFHFERNGKSYNNHRAPVCAQKLACNRL